MARRCPRRRRHTRRIRRLESAAERIAAGDLEAPIVAEGNDEVAELARGLDRMRVRLAHLDQARREFIGNASHELRTPLFALGGFLELLADEDLDEATRRDFLETARGQVDRLTRLATDLLDLSRLDADKREFGSEPVDLVATVTALAEEFGPLAEATGHELDVADGAAAVGLGDAERVLRSSLARRERASPHARRYDGGAACVDLGRSGATLRARRRPRYRSGRAGAGVRALLSRGRLGARGQRHRPGDCAGACPAHGWDDRVALGARFDDVHPRALARAAVAAFPRENVLVLEP